MRNLKLLLFLLFHIGPKSTINFFVKCLKEKRTVYHYKLKLTEVSPYPVKENFTHKIFYSYDELPDKAKNKIRKTFGREKLNVIKERLDYTTKMVGTFLNGELVSYCFFAYSREKFTFFILPENEIYFYDCFTFPKYRGKSAIYSEVKYIIDLFKTHNYKYANVEIEYWNTPSIKAFSKLGFKLYRIYILNRFLFIEKITEK